MPSRPAHALALALVLAAPAASAQQPPSDDPAKGAEPKASGDPAKSAELKERGDRAMDARRYADAAGLYRAAIEAHSDPSIFYNLGRAYQAMGEYPEAFRWLGRFDREAPAALRARVPRLDELLTELRARLTEVTIRANVSNARVIVRDRVVGTTPFSAPVTLVAGPALVEILAPGYVTYRREYQLKPGGEVLVDVQLAPADASKPAAPPARERPQEREGPGITSRWWFWAGVGAVAIAAGVVTYAALSTERAADRGEFGGPGPIRAPLVTFLVGRSRGWRPAGVTTPSSLRAGRSPRDASTPRNPRAHRPTR